jgi:hypothetical protein
MEGGEDLLIDPTDLAASAQTHSKIPSKRSRFFTGLTMETAALIGYIERDNSSADDAVSPPQPKFTPPHLGASHLPS